MPVLYLIGLALAACGFPGAPTAVPATPAPATATGHTATSAPSPTPAASVTPAPSPAPAAPTATATALPPSPAQTLREQAALSLRPGFEADVWLGLPLYELDIEVDPAAKTIGGSAIITLTNGAEAPLPDVVLRLYPNFPRDVLGQGGDSSLELSDVLANGQPLHPLIEAQGTVARIVLPQPLAPGQAVTLRFAFSGAFEPYDDGSLLLNAFYPMLSVYDDGQWRTDVTRFPDKVYAETALYRVTLRAPGDWTVVASGSELGSQELPGGIVQHQIVSGPVREWAMTLGQLKRFQSEQDGVLISVYQRVGRSMDAERVADVAAQALRSFARRFGSYPYAELDFHLLPSSWDAGTELPGLILLEVGGAVDTGTDMVVDHEVAHQYWYGLVGNDIFNEAWLDEALATYSSVLAALDRGGQQLRDQVYEDQVSRLVRRCDDRGRPPAGLPLDAYRDWSSYYCAVYGRGGAFVRELHELLGDEPFHAGLQSYFKDYRYGYGTRQRFQRAMEDAGGRSLHELFARWLGA